MTIEKAPQPLAQPDFNRLIAEVVEYVKWIERGKYHEDSDRAEWIFWEALEAVYGDRVFDWVNEVTQHSVE